jgi:hypothetical protein
MQRCIQSLDREHALPEIETEGADLLDGRRLSSGVTSDDRIRPLDAARQGPFSPSPPASGA